MAQLRTVLEELGLEGEVSPLGRWARVQGERGTVYVAHAAFGEGYYSWCDAPQERTAQPFLDPAEAIQAALQRARQPRSEKPRLNHSACLVSPSCHTENSREPTMTPIIRESVATVRRLVRPAQRMPVPVRVRPADPRYCTEKQGS